MAEDDWPTLVTGASSGIGRAITELLSAHGHPVFATARTKSDLASLARLPGVTPLRLDVTREDEIRRSFASIRRSGRGLYGLVNNAGIAEIVPLLDTSVEALHRLLDVNLYGMHRMVRAGFPFLAASRGRIVNISSTNGILPEAFAGAYCISKFAVEAYSDVLRDELSEIGIQVSVVEPGDFRSRIISSFLERKGHALVAALKNSPVGDAARRALAELEETPGELDRSRYPDPQPVAEAVEIALFSAKPRHRYLVGSQRETDEVIAKILRLLQELNQGTAHAVTPEELVDRLRSTLAGAGGS